jgi:single-strand DNA-binding protein
MEPVLRVDRESTWEDEMSRTINKVILVGNVRREPDVFETKNGTKVVHLSLATNRPPFGDDAEQRTDWHRLTLWAGLAQFTEENVKKGDRIYVERRLEYDAYEREGVKIPTADVNVRELVLLTAREAEVQVAA